MKKFFLPTTLLMLIMVIPVAAMAGVDVQVNIALPPPILFAAPPEVIVIPGTYVYVDPDIDADLFFWNGWWWRLWDGRWYRSHYYNRGWAYYNHAPRFYFDVDPGWREHYRDHNWYGRRWNYERIPSQRLQRNWSGWQKNRYWEKQRTWGVQNYQPHPPQQRQEMKRQWQEQYQQRPEVQHHQQQRPPQHEQPRRQPPERGSQGPRQEQYQPRQQHHQFEQPRQQHQGKGQEPQRNRHEGRPEGGEERHGR